MKLYAHKVKAFYSNLRIKYCERASIREIMPKYLGESPKTSTATMVLIAITKEDAPDEGILSL